MQELIIKYGGDLDEYYRLCKYVSYVFGNDVPRLCTMSEHMEINDDNPVLYLPWHKANTKEKRSKLMNKVIEYRCNETYGNKTRYPPQYILALYEDELSEVYDMAACVIQKFVRGVLTRNKYGVFNPHCDIGKKFLHRMFLYI